MPLSEGGASILQTAVGGLGNILSGVVGNIFNQKYVRRQREYEQMMYERNKQDSVRFWEMENQYNSPLMQMNRLKSAGLNPNLVYGHGATATGGSLNAPSPSVSNNTQSTNPLEGLNLGKFMSDMYNFKSQQANTDLVRQKIKSDMANQDLLNQTRVLKELESIRVKQSTQFEKDSYNTNLAQLNANISKTIAEIGNISQSTRTSQAVEDSTRINSLVSKDQNMRDWQKQNLSLHELAARIINTNANTDERRSNLGLIRSQTSKNYSEIQKTKIESMMLKLEKAMMDKGINPKSSGANRIMDKLMSGLEHGYESFRESFISIMKELH